VVFFLLLWPANLLNSVLSLILVGFDFTLSISSLCVRRRGLLYILLLSDKKVQGDSLYRLLSCTGLPFTCLVVLACLFLKEKRSCFSKRSALVNLRWSLAQLSGLLKSSWKAPNGLLILLLPITWPLILCPRPKCAFSEAGLLGYWCQGWSVPSERGWEGVLSWVPWRGGKEGGTGYS
jgi:hypothetical protein